MNYIQPNFAALQAIQQAQPVNFESPKAETAEFKKDDSFSNALEAAQKKDSDEVSSETVAYKKAEKNSESEKNEKIDGKSLPKSKDEKKEPAEDEKIAKKDGKKTKESKPKNSKEIRKEEKTASLKKDFDSEKSEIGDLPVETALLNSSGEEAETALDIDFSFLDSEEDISFENAEIAKNSKVFQAKNSDSDEKLDEEISDFLSKTDLSEIFSVAKEKENASKNRRIEKAALAYGADISVAETPSQKIAKNLSVKDLRTQKNSSVSKKEIRKTEKAGKEKIEPKAAGKKHEDLKFSYKQESAKKEEANKITLELSAQSGFENAEKNITSSSSQTASANGSNFQQMLSNSVQQNAQEFVKAGSIVLKDGNSGTINLILKPEKLGNVKISLSLSDKVVSGQITVASREAFDAFRESIESIRQAFAESGFETGAFDLDFSNEQGFAQNQNGENSEFAQKSRAESASKTYGEYTSGDLDSSSPADSYSEREHSFSVVA